MEEESSWRVLYVEDDPDLSRQVAEAVGKGRFGQVSLSVVTNFDDAREEVVNRRFDLLIMDVFQGKPSLERDRAGVSVVEHLQQVRFIPTIFYTALPSAVEGPASPFVKVLGKGGGGLKPLIDAVNAFINSGLLALNRGLAKHIEKVQLDYMQGFVAEHWEEFSSLPDKRALAYLLARRMAMSLSTNYMSELALALGEVLDEVPETTSTEHQGKVHPMQMYIIPPVAFYFLTGDIVEGSVRDHFGHWVVLTPSCDMEIRIKEGRSDAGHGNKENQPEIKEVSAQKAEYVALAYGVPLQEFEEFKEWLKQPSSTGKKKALMELMKNNRRTGQADRYHYLPGVFNIPHLVIDFQQMRYVPFGDLQSFRRLASLDSPYAEALLGRFNRYGARVGTPDLDIENLVRGLNKPVSE